MEAEYVGELLWHRHGGNTKISLLLPSEARREGQKRGGAPLYFGEIIVHPVASAQKLDVVYRQPILIRWQSDHYVCGPIMAILAGFERGSFSGSRANYRDIMRVAADEGKFIYVIAPDNVVSGNVWKGHVRIGYQKWISVPCPRPDAVYNRVPTRNAERSQAVVAAKRSLKAYGIPLFNPDYFNKKVIYDVLERSQADVYLPATSKLSDAKSLDVMLRTNSILYLKPTGGSIGHGILRVDALGSNRYRLSVLKNHACTTYKAENLRGLWSLIRQHRLPGEYVIQAGKSLIEFKGSPCDFRVLTQKNRDQWEVVGIGVRVSGPETITTHVPGGGYIASADTVLARTFGDRAREIEQEMRQMIRTCAQAIDAHYRGELGEMSMDIGLDKSGRLWFFEANAKPMKFDEPDIRSKSIQGVLRRLEQISRRNRMS